MHMKEETLLALKASVQGYRLPRFDQIPDIGLYLEQLTKYISEYTEPLGLGPMTGSMVSNYVKQGIIDRPVKKQYCRDQIAHLIFIALAKSVLSLDDLQKFICLQQRTYAVSTAYNFFCQEMDAGLHIVFDSQGDTIKIPPSSGDEKTILRNIVIAIAHKIYLEKYIAAVTRELDETENA